ALTTIWLPWVASSGGAAVSGATVARAKARTDKRTERPGFRVGGRPDAIIGVLDDVMLCWGVSPRASCARKGPGRAQAVQKKRPRRVTSGGVENRCAGFDPAAYWRARRPNAANSVRPPNSKAAVEGSGIVESTPAALVPMRSSSIR